jgi:hypothetical protein
VFGLTPNGSGAYKAIVTGICIPSANSPDGRECFTDVGSEMTYKGEGEVFYEWPILTQPQNKRVAVVIPVDEFADFLKTSTNGTFTVDHIFDY